MQIQKSKLPVDFFLRIMCVPHHGASHPTWRLAEANEMDQLTTPSRKQSTTSEKTPASQAPRFSWLKVTAFAVASAVTGGLAAAWYYRKTLSTLQQAELDSSNSNFGISEPEDGDGDCGVSL
jgi:hypothetical protein